MKEIDVIVKKFEANDGTRFNSKEDCEKHEEECKKSNEDVENRIAMIKEKRNKMDEEKAERDRKEKLEYNELREKTRSIKHRIKGLISVANELLNNNLLPYISAFDSNIFLDKYGYHYGDKISFRDEFLEPYRSDGYGKKSITYIGTNGLGFLGTDGESISSNEASTIGSKRIMLKWILEDYDRFETAFYKYVDDIIK